MNTVLVTQSFGRENEYRRALFAILSALAFIPSEEQKKLKIALHTDAPEFFQKHLAPFDVRYFMLDPEKIKRMRGQIDFLHRMKIVLIEETFEAFPEHCLFYTDSDTFFRKNLFGFLKIHSDRDMYMHTDEYAFSALKNPDYAPNDPFRLYIEKVVNQEFRAADKTIRVDENLHSFNAGVMCFHPEHKKLLPEVYSLTDQTYPITGNHAAEQYAFSIIFQKYTRVKFIENDAVFHYWHHTQKKYMDHFLASGNQVSAEEPIAEKLERIRIIIRKLPEKMISSHYVHMDQAIQDWNNNSWFRGTWHFLIASFKKPVLFFSNFRHFLYHSKRMIFKKQRKHAGN